MSPAEPWDEEKAQKRLARAKKFMVVEIGILAALFSSFVIYSAMILIPKEIYVPVLLLFFSGVLLTMLFYFQMDMNLNNIRMELKYRGWSLTNDELLDGLVKAWVLGIVILAITVSLQIFMVATSDGSILDTWLPLALMVLLSIICRFAKRYLSSLNVRYERIFKMDLEEAFFLLEKYHRRFSLTSTFCKLSDRVRIEGKGFLLESSKYQKGEVKVKVRFDGDTPLEPRLSIERISGMLEDGITKIPWADGAKPGAGAGEKIGCEGMNDTRQESPGELGTGSGTPEGAEGKSEKTTIDGSKFETWDTFEEESKNEDRNRTGPVPRDPTLSCEAQWMEELARRRLFFIGIFLFVNWLLIALLAFSSPFIYKAQWTFIALVILGTPLLAYLQIKEKNELQVRIQHFVADQGWRDDQQIKISNFNLLWKGFIILAIMISYDTFDSPILAEDVIFLVVIMTFLLFLTNQHRFARYLKQDLARNVQMDYRQLRTLDWQLLSRMLNGVEIRDLGFKTVLTRKGTTVTLAYYTCGRTKCTVKTPFMSSELNQQLRNTIDAVLAGVIEGTEMAQERTTQSGG